MAIAFIGTNIYFYTMVLTYLQITADGVKNTGTLGILIDFSSLL